MSTEPKSRLQFSLFGLLLLVTMAAVVAASLTQLPVWIGAPLLAIVATVAAAVVSTAAIQSKGRLRTFYFGAAFPLLMLLVKTSIVSDALVRGISDDDPINVNLRLMAMYNGGGYDDPRTSYRLLAAGALACAPLIGLLCVGYGWLSEPAVQPHSVEGGASATRRLPTFVMLGLLVLLLTGFMALVAAWRRYEASDGYWDRHNGAAVTANGSPVAADTELTTGDRVFVEQASAWWRGRVIKVLGPDQVEIHYVGWDSSNDEVVSRSRLQIP
ncbi:MAG TPA: hypothetical protein VGX78_06900 [Pirellulales bacterium]|nr:hypothetical protein [Pirellulales bacterium]